MPRVGVSGSPAARAFTPKESGRYYFEWYEPNGVGPSGGIGLVRASKAAGGGVGNDTNSLRFTNTGNVIFGGATILATGQVLAALQRGRMCYNANSKQIWVRNHTAPWNANALADPIQGIGGIDVSAMAGLLYGLVCVDNPGSGRQSKIVLNLADMLYPPPASYFAPRGQLDPAYNSGGGTGPPDYDVVGSGGGLSWVRTVRPLR